jgi:hypothetical protein
MKISKPSAKDEIFCRTMIDKMLSNSQTKVIFPIVTLGLLKEFYASGKTVFKDSEVRRAYESAVRSMKEYLGHDLHIGGKYYDAYPSRNLPRYDVLRTVAKNNYELLPPYTDCATNLIEWIPGRIKERIEDRIGIIPRLSDKGYRSRIAEDKDAFIELLNRNLDSNAANFEIFSFAVLRVHLERFACKIYRDTRTAAHDRGVDLSTNFGVVYQIKKLKVFTTAEADGLYAELKVNFDTERLRDGNVILVIDDISKDVKNYLINMKVQSISKHEVVALASNLEDPEDREKILRIIHDEFRREYSSDID